MKHLKIFLVLVFTFTAMSLAYSQSQKRQTENIIIITLDGFRWEELFGGIDKDIIDDKASTKDPKGLQSMFGASTPEESRKKLLPFFWTEIASKGQLYGNRNFGNNVNVANKYLYSYPGYNEMFTGYADIKIKGNDKIPNPNKNVLEYLNQQEKYKDQVAAFTSWDVFSAIFNRERSKFLVNSGSEPVIVPGKQLSPKMELLNEMQSGDAHFLESEIRDDLLTFYTGLEYIKEYHPRVVFLGFDGTDDFAHQGLYDYYLKQANASDKCIAELWNYVQSDPQYKDKTTLILLCDHGRGNNPKGYWTSHGDGIPESGETWLAVIGPDTPPLGEVKTKGQLYNKQLAPTIAAFLGLQFSPEHGEAKVISSAIK
jgi:hypothetical protein